MKACKLFVILIIISSCGYSQNPETNSEKDFQLIGTCEGCEAVFEYGDKNLTAVDTLPDFNNDGVKIKVSGIVYEKDGKTPSKETILYFYHTNNVGVYPTKEGETGWVRRHGYIRGWIKTNGKGEYTIYTLRPGAYPERNNPEHIHMTVLEPDGSYYWINDYFFEDDPLLKKESVNITSPRGGTSGILELKKEDDLYIGKRDIILGKNL